MLALQQESGRKVSLLDGETIRQELSAELGYSRQDRETNIHRMAFVASELTKAGAATVCAAIAPYETARQRAREAIGKHGGFYLIYMATPLEHAIERDRQGVYERAHKGEIKGAPGRHAHGRCAGSLLICGLATDALWDVLAAGFTGVDDPYEPPAKYDAKFDLSTMTVSQIVHEIILLLERDGYIGSS